MDAQLALGIADTAAQLALLGRIEGLQPGDQVLYRLVPAPPHVGARLELQVLRQEAAHLVDFDRGRWHVSRTARQARELDLRDWTTALHKDNVVVASTPAWMAPC